VVVQREVEAIVVVRPVSMKGVGDAVESTPVVVVFQTMPVAIAPRN
jgi:hypothetical protein